MDRKALSMCASLLVLVVLASSVGYHALRTSKAVRAPRAPRLLSGEARADAAPLSSAESRSVTPAGLIEAAVPPTTRKKAPQSAEKAPTIKLTPGQPSQQSRGASPKPTKIAPVPVSPRGGGTPIVLRPIEPNGTAAKNPGEPSNQQDSPFRFRDGASALANPQLPQSTADDRVLPPRSALAAPSIAPAVQPTVPPRMPLVVPAPAPAPAVVKTAPQHELKIATPEPTPAVEQPAPQVAGPQPTPAAEAPSKPDASEPTPAGIANQESPTPAPEQKPSEHKWVKKKPKNGEPSVAKNEPTPAQAPAAEETKVTGEPTLAQPQPTPATESVAGEPTPAKMPVAVDVAPTPAPVAAAPVEVDTEEPEEPALADRGETPAMPLADAPDGQVLPDGEYTKLPWAEPSQRGPELIADLKRADERVLKGYDLASRGAVYAARAEFISAIKIVAQAYDNQEGTRRYSKAATAGLTAIKEASDFTRTTSTLREVEIASVLVGHSTPVLKDSDTSDMPPMAAARCYYNYAQEQLSAAVGQEICGSMALYAMGKVAVMSAKPIGATNENAAQAMALYRAALIAYPKNFRAANELGVLLAQNGQYELARDLLIRSVVVSPQATTWKNLAAIHTRIGEHQMAERAKQRALAMQQHGQDLSSTPAVQWVDPAVFASTASSTDTLPVAPSPQSQISAAKAATKAGDKPNASPAAPPVKVAKKPFENLLKPGSRQQ